MRDLMNTKNGHYLSFLKFLNAYVSLFSFYPGLSLLISTFWVAVGNFSILPHDQKFWVRVTYDTLQQIKFPMRLS